MVVSHPTYESERDESPSASPYPPSTPGSSDNEDGGHSPLAITMSSAFLLLLDSIPESKLRDAVAKVAGGNQRFQRALQTELTRIDIPRTGPAQFIKSQYFLTPPTTPTTPRVATSSFQHDTRRREASLTPKTATKVASKPRRSRRRTHPSLSYFSSTTASSDERYYDPLTGPSGPAPADPPSVHGNHREFVHHPGQLKDDAYEFVSRSPGGATLKTVRTIAMWSCCDEDEHSPGCVRTRPVLTRHSDSESRGRGRRRKTPDRSLPPPALPLGTIPIDDTSINMEDDIEFTSFAISKYSPIETTTRLPGDLQDAYPDSDLEIMDTPFMSHPPSR